MVDIEDPLSPPRKKIRLEDTTMASNSAPTFAAPQATMGRQEEDVGIIAYVNPDLPGFSGVFKKRYTDFLVNEVLPSGEVVHLLSARGPGKASSQSGPEPKQEPVTEIETAVEPQPASEETKEEPEPSNGHAPESVPVQALEQETEKLPTEESGQATETTPAQDAGQSQADGISAWQKFSETTGTLKFAPNDKVKLLEVTTEQVAEKLLALFNKVLARPGMKAKDYGSVNCGIIDDKDKRFHFHKAVREVFKSRLETYTEDDGSIIAQAATQNNFERGGFSNRGRGGTARGRGGSVRGRGGFGGEQRNKRPTFQELGGDYLHFTVYKENRDTMEVVSFLARELKVKPQSFQFAGTKDRRGVTVQRISVFRIFADRIIGVGKKGRGWKVGDFEYKSYPLALGDLGGNEFTITLRDCHGQEHVGAAVEGLKRGFVNYFGMQRFGTFATRTDTVGVHLLKGDFQSAVAAILKYPQHCLEAALDPDSAAAADTGHDDKARALAVHYFEQGDTHKALATIPRKFSAENQLMRHLSGKNAGDYLGAVQTIQRNLKLMYVHAYQSVIWNLAATHRWTVHGDKILEGDLVLVNEHKEETKAAEPVEEIDADGEVVIQPTSEDRAVTDDDRFERARALTAEEAASGKFTIFDIVLPTPGYDILYPSFMAKFYEETMAKDEYGNLNPHDMRRKQRDFSLSGSYRKLMSRVEDAEYEIKEYKSENEQFVKTDADLMYARNRAAAQERGAKDDEAAATEVKPDTENGAEADKMDTETEEPIKTAVILKFKLGSSQYATMALRELMKGGLETYKMDFSGGR